MGEAERTGHRSRHTAGQRIVLVINCLVVVMCLGGAIGLVIGKRAAEQSKRVTLAPQSNPTTSEATRSAASASTLSVSTSATSPASTVIASDPLAKNFLVVGVDNNACIDPNSKYAGGIGTRSAMLTDTIMVIRVDPSTKRVAVLSFPRDLWVRVNGSMRKINSAYRNNDPTALVETIDNEFGVKIDHFIRVDFCAFMELVDAVGGISVPLPYAVRDTAHTGLEVPDAGCHRFAGDEALAYVRSRHLEYRDESGAWHKDLSSDFGRIARQQDFLRRTLSAAQHQLLSPEVIRGLYSTYKNYLVIDDQLSISDIIDFAALVRDVDPTNIRTYQIDVTGRRVSGQAVLIANDTANTTAILDLFRGKTDLGAIPDQIPETTTTLPSPATPFPSAPIATTATATASPTPASAGATTTATEPESNAPPNAIVPNPAIEC